MADNEQAKLNKKWNQPWPKLVGPPPQLKCGELCPKQDNGSNYGVVMNNAYGSSNSGYGKFEL